MTRSVADAALFQNIVSGPHPHDQNSLREKVQLADAVQPMTGLRIAWSMDLGYLRISSEVRRNTLAALDVFRQLGCVVEEACPDVGDAGEVFLALRSQHFLVDLELMLENHRDKLKPDLVWNIEKGQKQPASRLAWAERERAAL